LREREHLRFARRDLPGGVQGWYSADAEVILIDRTLGRAERNAVLAHELVHQERGGGAGYAGQPATWDAVVAREERNVDIEVARRLVPPDELAAWVGSHSEPVTAEMVAEHFDVPLWVVRALTNHPTS
jgi:hypothetical protein